jgi:hypothetical protein
MKTMKFEKLRSEIKAQAHKLSEDGFQQIFDRIDQLNIKKGVDKLGIDKFIDQCAYLAAGSGVISGSGGMLTMIIGMPVDFVNLITQQFRVSMAIMYDNRGDYEFTFHDFMSLIATSLKVEAGITLTKTMMEGIAEKMLLMLGTRTAERMVPIVGAVIGGTTNYLFIKRMARSVQRMQLAWEPAVIS